MPSQCAVNGCNEISVIRGWCSKHYQRWRRHGDPSLHYPGVRRSIESACTVCGVLFKIEPNQIERGEGKYCSRKCHHEAMRGRASSTAAPIGSKRLRPDGYVEIKTEQGQKHWSLEHRHVMETHLGRILDTGEHVHHLNGNKADNRLENLVVYTNAEHAAIHEHWNAWTTKHVALICEMCGSSYTRKPSKAVESKFCSNECRMKGMHKARRIHAAQRRKNRI